MKECDFMGAYYDTSYIISEGKDLTYPEYTPLCYLCVAEEIRRSATTPAQQRLHELVVNGHLYWRRYL